METMTREAWTDDRLDDLANRMDRGFDRVDKDIRDLRVESKSDIAQLRGEMIERFDKVDERFDKVDSQFDERFARIDARLDSIQHAIIFGAVGMTSGVAAVIASLMVTGA